MHKYAETYRFIEEYLKEHTYGDTVVNVELGPDFTGLKVTVGASIDVPLDAVDDKEKLKESLRDLLWKLDEL